MGRSDLGLSFLTSVGARLMVVRPNAKENPELVKIVITWSHDSFGRHPAGVRSRTKHSKVPSEPRCLPSDQTEKVGRKWLPVGVVATQSG
jgi:hypothetical protein